jgi:transcription initiation factor TFIID subunit 5
MAAIEDEEMEKKVQQYLHRKGFRLTELALHEERSRLSTSDVALTR